MSRKTQVVQTALASLGREISAIRAQTQALNSSEHWQVAHAQTREHGARRAAAVVVALSCLLLGGACNVYESSLLDSSLVASAGAAGGSIPAGNGASHAGGEAGSLAGYDGTSGASGDAGAFGTVGGSDSGGVGGASGGASGGSTVPGGAGGGPETGGNAAGGATSTTLSIIDDMENTDAYIPLTDMRQGYWSLSNDGTAGGKQTPSPTMIMSAIPGGRNGSLSGLHTTAVGFTASGALVGVDLNRKGSAVTTRLTYDASAYQSVHFWAKVEASSPRDIRFAILDKHTDPGGAMCCPSKAACGTGNIANGLCYDHFNKDLTLTHEWAEYTIPFSELNQTGWGENNVVALDAAHVFNIQLSWTSAAMDLWLDDISFVKK